MDTRVLIGKQNQKGTPETATLTVMNAVNFNVKPEVNKIESKVLGAGRWTKDSFPGRLSVSGDIEFEPCLGELEILLEGAGFKKNQSEYKADAFEKYLTFINDFPTDGLNLEYSDCLINTLSINASQEAFINVKAGVIGMANKVNEAKANGTAKAIEESQLICYGASLHDTSKDISAEVQSVEISINNSLEGRGGLNSRHNTKILQSGRGSVELNIEFNGFDKENYVKAMKMLTDNSSVELKLKLQENITDGTKGRQMEITMPKVKLTNVELGDLEGVGTITKSMAVLPNAEGQPIIFKVIEKGASEGPSK